MTRGFTLLEVMISLAILAVALVAISDLNGGAVAMHAYGRRATEAALLLKGKMLDIEDELQKNGFSDFSDEKHGTFENEGAAAYSWSAEILKPDVQLDPAQLLGMIGVGGGDKQQKATGGIAGAASALAAQLGGAKQALQGMQGGGAAAMLGGPLGGMLQGQAKTFIEQLKKSVREVRLTVSWRDGSQQRSVSGSQMIVILPEMVGKAGQIPQQALQPQPGATAPQPLPGQPIQIPRQP
jgi:general secretion pathway protein I